MSYLEAAGRAGNWLVSAAERGRDGWCWPVRPGVSAEIEPGVGWGTAGPAMFFVEAFRTTGDERWLAAATEGRRWMAAHLGDYAGQWAGCGLFTGIGGWAVVLDELADAAGDEAARQLAGRVLEEVAARASADGGGVHWHDLTEILWGTAGVGCLMLTLGADYLGSRALELAIGAGDWLLSQAERAPAGIRWSLGRAYEQERPDDKRRFPNFAHGAAGIGFFLARLTEVTGEPRFLDGSLAATEWIMTTVRTDDGTCAAFHHDPGGTELFTLGWCHGPPGLGGGLHPARPGSGRHLRRADVLLPRAAGRPQDAPALGLHRRLPAHRVRQGAEIRAPRAFRLRCLGGLGQARRPVRHEKIFNRPNGASFLHAEQVARRATRDRLGS